MQTDFGSTYLSITHFRRRRARAHLFAFSARYVALVCAIVLGMAIGLGFLTERAHSQTFHAALSGFGWTLHR